eukprot:597316-Heterocapsa_arctica.AAC.1
MYSGVVHDSRLRHGEGGVQSAAVGDDVEVVGASVVMVILICGRGEYVMLSNDGRDVVHCVLKVALEHACSAVDIIDVNVNWLLVQMPRCFLLTT